MQIHDNLRLKEATLDQYIQVAMDDISRGEGIKEAQLLEHIKKRKQTFFKHHG